MTPADFFHRLLDESAATLARPGTHALPTDELHTEILIPLLPAMIGDEVIRSAWRTPGRRGFFSKMQTCRETGGDMPAWEPDDFEIHVTASYLAGPDAKALADTLLSEPSLRDLTAALMNQLLEIVWSILPPTESAPAAPQAAIVEIVPTAELAALAESAVPSVEIEEAATAPEPPQSALPTWQWIAESAKSAHIRLTGSSLPVFVRVLCALRRPATAIRKSHQSVPPRRRKKFR